MTSPLEGQLKKAIAAGFKGRLTKGTLRRATIGGLDSWGDPLPASSVDVAFEGIRESFSAPFMARAGIPDTDVSILILLGSMSPGLMPKQDDVVYMKAPWNKWYKCRKVLEIDPAGASCRLQAYEIPAP
jgi:hypothetical protein